MHPCNRGEKLTRSVQENAANRRAAMRTRTQVCERPELFIGLRACDNRRNCASKFLGGARTSRVAIGALANRREQCEALNAGYYWDISRRGAANGTQGACAPQKWMSRSKC